MNRFQAILMSLLVAAVVGYAGADVPNSTAAQPAWRAEGLALSGASPTVILAENEGTTGESPANAGPADETGGTGSQPGAAPGSEGGETIESQPPAGTGNLPGTVEPGDESGGMEAPSEPAPGSSY